MKSKKVAASYNIVKNVKTGELFKIPARPPAPKFKPKDRTNKPLGRNQYV